MSTLPPCSHLNWNSTHFNTSKIPMALTQFTNMSHCVQDTVLGTTWEDINNIAPAQKELWGQVEEY